MKKEKNDRILVVVSLIVAIITLTVGFAAFSNTLTISSSATVTPNESDFNINVYGITDFKGSTIVGTNSLPSIEWFTSETTSVANKYSSSDLALTASDSKITDNGKSITISDINVGLTEPGQSVSYFYLIKNEGEYDVYMDIDKYIWEDMTVNSYPIEGTCTAGKETSETLVNEACPYVTISTIIDRFDHSGNSPLQINKGEYIMLQRNISYDSNGKRADGDFSVSFEDLTLEFTSVPPAE